MSSLNKKLGVALRYADLRCRFHPEEDETEILVAYLKHKLSSDELFELLQSFAEFEKQYHLTDDYLRVKDALDTVAHEKNLVELMDKN